MAGAFPIDFSTENFYRLMNLSSSATAGAVERRRRQLAMQYHPDKNEGALQFTEAMKRINLAAETLSDPEKRAKLDQMLAEKGELVADADAIPLPAGPRFSETFTSQLPVYAARFNAGTHHFVNLDKIIKQFNHDWQSTRAMIPSVQKTATLEIEQEEETTDALIEARLAKIISCIRKGDLVTVYAAKSLWSANEWRAVMRRLWQRQHDISLSHPTRQPHLRFVLSLAAHAIAADAKACIATYEDMAEAVWSMIAYPADKDNVSSIAAYLVTDELATGYGHTSSSLQDYSLTSEQLTRRLFPSEQLARRLVLLPESLALSLPDAITWIYRIEKAIKRKVETGECDAKEIGDCYLDAAVSGSSSAQLLFLCIAGAKWYLKAFLAAARPVERYCIKEMILHILELTWSNALHHARQAYLLLYVCGTAFAILRTVLLEAPEIVEQENVKALSQFAKHFADFARFVPLPHLPNVCACEADILRYCTDDLLSNYLSNAMCMPEERLPMESCFLCSEIYSNHINSVSTVEHPEAVREVAIDLFLKQRRNKSSWSDIECFLRSPLHSYDEAGWLTTPDRFAGSIQAAGIRSIQALRISKLTGDVQFEFDMSSAQPLISSNDFAVALQRPEFGSFLSLDGLREDHYVAMHPLQNLIFHPEQLAGSGLLHSIFLADYLMKQFSLGEEISVAAPFKMRRLSSSPVWQKLPSELKTMLKPVDERKEFDGGSMANRFWIQVDEVELFSSDDDKFIYHKFGEVKTTVRSHPLLPNQDGELMDTVDDDTKASAPKKFAEDFTQAFDQLGAHYAVFARLKALAKVMLAAAIVNDTHRKFKEALALNEPLMPGHYAEHVNRNAAQYITQFGAMTKPASWETARRQDLISQCVTLGVKESDVLAWLSDTISTVEFSRRVVEAQSSFASFRSHQLGGLETRLDGISKFIDSAKRAHTPTSTTPAQPVVVPAVYKFDNGMTRVAYGGVSILPSAVKQLDAPMGMFTSATWTQWHPQPCERGACCPAGFGLHYVSSREQERLPCCQVRLASTMSMLSVSPKPTGPRSPDGPSSDAFEISDDSCNDLQSASNVKGPPPAKGSSANIGSVGWSTGAGDDWKKESLVESKKYAKVVTIQKYTRIVDSSAGLPWPLRLVNHDAVVVGLEDGSMLLLEKGKNYGGAFGNQTVATYASEMDPAIWHKSSKVFKAQEGTTLGDLAKISGQDYNLFLDNCITATARILEPYLTTPMCPPFTRELPDFCVPFTTQHE